MSLWVINTLAEVGYFIHRFLLSSSKMWGIKTSFFSSLLAEKSCLWVFKIIMTPRENLRVWVGFCLS